MLKKSKDEALSDQMIIKQLNVIVDSLFQSIKGRIEQEYHLF
jgi:hypothetical protein